MRVFPEFLNRQQYLVYVEWYEKQKKHHVSGRSAV